MLACVRCEFITNVWLESSCASCVSGWHISRVRQVNGILFNAILSFHLIADNAIAELVRGVSAALWRDNLAAPEPRPVRHLWPERLWSQSELQQLSIVVAASSASAAQPLFRHNWLRRGNNRFTSISCSHRLAQFFSQPNAPIVFAAIQTAS
jgi:hypothetical protein